MISPTSKNTSILRHDGTHLNRHLGAEADGSLSVQGQPGFYSKTLFCFVIKKEKEGKRRRIHPDT